MGFAWAPAGTDSPAMRARTTTLKHASFFIERSFRIELSERGANPASPLP